MANIRRPTFQFKNNVSPSYVEPLFLQIEFNRWYSTGELRELLRTSGLNVDGRDIVLHNISTWALAGLGTRKSEKSVRSQVVFFRLTALGQQLKETYGTDKRLFYDIIHFLFYSAWHRSYDIFRARFWLYATVCETLWNEAPGEMDSFGLTNRLQNKAEAAFPEYQPAFPERSVRSIFHWLGVLDPPFLEKNGSQLHSRRRDYCTPQLFHLATDLIYTRDGLKYGTSLSIDERHIKDISTVCLLDESKFWSMADLTKMAIRGFEIRKGQWGTSIALEGPVHWIDLPNFAELLPPADTEAGEQEKLTDDESDIT